MPRPVVPMAFGPRARSRARSSSTCEGRIRGHSGDTRSRSKAGTPCSISMAASASSASSESTTPLPMKQRTPSWRIPAGISERMVLRPPMTSVWPALCPPWKRATAAARSVSRSTTLPLPSSPHWVPITTTNLPTTSGSLTDQVENDDTDQHGAEAGDAQLAVAHLQQPGEGALDTLRIQKRRDSFQHQEKSERGEQVGKIQRHGKGKWASAPRLGRLRRVLEVFEESAVGGDDQQVPVLAERVLVGLEAAIEGVELRVLGIGFGVDLRRGRIALALDAQRIPLGIGEDDGALPLGLGTDAGAGALAFGAQPARGLVEALLHALVDTRRHLIRQIDALHAHVHQVDAEPQGVAARLSKHLPGDGGPLRGDDLLQRALRHDALDAVLDDLGESLAGEGLAAGRRGVIDRRVLDAPLDVEIDDQPATVVGEKSLAGVGLREDAPVELRDHVPRPLEVQPRGVARVDDGAKARADGVLGLTHRKERERGEDQQNSGRDEHREQPRAHQRSPRPRASIVTPSGSLDAPAAGSTVWSSRPALFSRSLSIGR